MAKSDNPAPARTLTKDGDAVVRTVDAIRSWIVTGKLAGGEQLRQEEMAAELDISRAPIREALRTLADQGLLEHRVHSGYFVKKWPSSELRQIYQMLEFLESLVMSEIGPADDEVLAELRSLNEQMSALVSADDWSAMVDLNRRFHFAIFRLSPLNVVLDELERLWTIAAPYIAQRYAIEAMRRRTVEEHDEMIKALADGELTRANDLLKAHRSSRSPGN